MKESKIIPFIDNVSHLSHEELNNTMVSNGFMGKIDQVNWKAFGYKPTVSFYLAHNNEVLFILYKVNEENARATVVKDNDAVWEDSCAEAFFATDINKGYFNIEANCIGTVLVGYGKERDNRTHLDDNRIKTIKRVSSLGKEIIGKEHVHGDWWLQLAIPFEILGVTKGQTIRANFYKCGDKCKVPHFLSWQPIPTPQPDFHQPDFFAELILENPE